MTTYYMGIDNGGTLCKAVLFDNTGKAIASASEKVEMLTPRPGFTERDMNDLWDANLRVIAGAVKKSGIDPCLIKGVACTGHGKGLYLWGKNNEPCYNGIISTDSRAVKYPKIWQEQGITEKVFEKTCQSILASQPVSLLSWLKEYEPDVIDQIKWIFEVKDYIRFRLTGEAFAEMTDRSGSCMMNLKTRSYDRDLLALFDLEEVFEALPPLKKSTDICGRITSGVASLTGLAEGTPVAGGMFDIDACAIAMDITNSENICVIAGTWSINEYISREPVLNHSVMMNSLYCMDDYYLIEECSPTSAGNLEWYINMYMGDDREAAREKNMNIYQYCDYLVDSSRADDSNLLFLPYLFGSNYNPSAKACFIGLDSHHSKADILRAVFEGIVYCHMVHLEKLLLNKARTRAVRLAGGAAKSRVWAQMFSDVTGLPVEVIDTDELGALGCAMAASVAAGTNPDLPAAASSMVTLKESFTPCRTNTEIYRKKYEHYKTVSEKLDDIW